MNAQRKASSVGEPEKSAGTRVGSAVQSGHDNTLIIGDRVTLDVEHFAVTMAPSPVPLLIEVPPDAAYFTGRRRELAHVQRLLTGRSRGSGTGVAIAAIAGKPGVGKSALAVHAAHKLAGVFSDGQLYINLRGADDKPLSADAALDELLRRFGVSGETMPQTLEGKAALYRRQVAGRKILVILDNAASEQQVRPLLPGNPACAAIVTSRQVLAALDATPIVLEVLDDATAATLLRRMTGSARLRGQQEATAAVAKLCGYLPLALRIAGAKLALQHLWTMAHLAERLADERRRLEELGVGDLDVRACFALSYRDLPAADARAFRMLGLIPGPDFACDVAGVILMMESGVAAEHMEQLTRLQLLEFAPGAGRFRFHDLLRLYARERLEADGSPEDREDASDRMFYWYSHMAEILGGAVGYPRMHEQVFGMQTVLLDSSGLVRFEAERESLFAATHAAFRDGDAHSGYEIGQRLMEYLFRRGFWKECERTARAVAQAEHFSIGTRELYATQRAHIVLGRLYSRQGNWRAAISNLELAQFFEDNSHFEATGEIGYELGNANSALKNWSRAKDHYLRARRFYEEKENGYAIAMTAVGLGRVHRSEGEWSASRDYLEEARSWFMSAGEHEGIAMTAAELGGLSSDLREWEEALSWYEQSLASWRELEVRELVNMSGAAAVLNGIAIMYRHQCRLDDAAILHEQAQEVFQALGIRDGEAEALAGIADIRVAQNRHEEAAPLLERAISVLGKIGSDKPELWEKAARAGSASAAFHLARRIAVENPPEEERWYRKAADGGNIDAAVNLGVMLQDRDPAEAETLYRIAAESGDSDGQYNLAMLLWRTGRNAEVMDPLCKAAAGGQLLAQHQLGNILAGAGHRKEAEAWLAKAEAGLRKSAKEGDVRSATVLGTLLWEQERRREAQAFLRKAANSGDVRASQLLEQLFNEEMSVRLACGHVVLIKDPKILSWLSIDGDLAYYCRICEGHQDIIVVDPDDLRSSGG